MESALVSDMEAIVISSDGSLESKACLESVPLEVMGMILRGLRLDDLRNLIKSSRKALMGLQAQRDTILPQVVKSSFAPEA